MAEESRASNMLSPASRTTKGVAFREGMVEELARLVDLEGFDEGQEALGRLRAALDRLEGCRNDVDDSVKASGATGPGDVYSMMVQIEQQTARVERGLENLSHHALEIVSSALIDVDAIGTHDAKGANAANETNETKETNETNKTSTANDIKRGHGD